MSEQPFREWSEIEILLTPGERFQNWLAGRGLWERVPPRDLHHPEPPPGLWSVMNGVTVIAAIAGLVCVLWLTLFRVIPILTALRAP